MNTSQEYSDKMSHEGNALLQLVSQPFKRLGWQIVHGVYINDIYREDDRVHNLSVFLEEHRKHVGHTDAVAFIETFCECFYFTYNVNDVGEFDEHLIKFYTKELELLYSYSGNNIT